MTRSRREITLHTVFSGLTPRTEPRSCALSAEARTFLLRTQADTEPDTAAAAAAAERDDASGAGLPATRAPDLEQLGSVPVGFVATIRHNSRPEPGGLIPFRAHRTVVLPTWQGMGIGGLLSDAVARLHVVEGRRYFGQTVHPALGAHRDRSPLWRATEWNHSLRQFRIENWKQRLQNVRVRLRVPRYTYSHEFVLAPQPEGEAETGEVSKRARPSPLSSK